jgi:hypothetical protein
MTRLPTLIAGLTAATLLSGCSAVHQNIERVNNSLYEGSQKTRAKIAGYIYEETAEPVIPPPHPQSYCYNVRSDIVCYDRPKPALVTQRVGTGEVEVSYAPLSEEFEVSQMYNNATGTSRDSVRVDVNKNLGKFFNPANPGNTGDTSLRFGSALNPPTRNFIPEAPIVRGVNDPVSVTPGRGKTTGFAPQPPARTSSANARVPDMGKGSSTMNTPGPEPTRPLPGFEAPSPLINTF